MDERFSVAEVAERTGARPEDLHAWAAHGLLPRDDAGRFSPDVIDRVRLIQTLLRRGITLDDVASWAATGEMERHLRLIASPPGTLYSIAEAAERTALPAALVRTFVDVIGHGAHDSRRLNDEDLECLRVLRPALEAGLSEQAVLQLARVFADAMRRVAETEANLFHVHVRRRLIEQGLDGAALDEAVWRASTQLEPLDEPALRYFHRRALRHAIVHTTVLEVAERAGLQSARAGHGLPAIVAFVDLASFTPLAEAMGDEEAAEVLARFSRLVREIANEHDGHIVKQIGDAFMIVFPDAASSVTALLAIDARTAREGHFPAIRGGINAGDVVFQEGEYVGTTVNVAARLADAAARHQVLVGPEVRRTAGALAGVAFRSLGAQRLKGLTDPIEVYEAVAAHRPGAAPLIDPVCGMELAPDEVSVRLSSGGEDLAFCSQECLRRWVARSE